MIKWLFRKFRKKHFWVNSRYDYINQECFLCGIISWIYENERFYSNRLEFSMECPETCEEIEIMKILNA